MSQFATTRHPEGPTIEQTIFTPAEVAEFQQDDRRAGGAIVIMMAGIFALGLIGYLGICWWIVS
jgi:hypothetical protein